MKHLISCGSIFFAFLFTLFTSCPASAQTAHYLERVDLFSQLNDIDSTSVVMLGNSLTENGGDWNVLLGTTGVVNRGIIGDDAHGIIRRLHQILPHRPKAIFLMCGTNDLSHNLTPQQVFDSVRIVIDSIRAGSPGTKLYVQSLLPFNESFKRWKTLEGKSRDIPAINRLLRQYCREQHITFINLYPYFIRKGTATLQRSLTTDGLHLSKPGYQIWAATLRRYM